MGDVSPLVTLGAIITAVFGPILTWLVARRKVEIDESAEVFQRWKGLTDRMEAMAAQHALDMKDVREELRIERMENAALRKRVKELEDEVAGLRRQIIQNSKSSAQLIGDPDGVATSKAARRARGDDEEGK